jgi:outer membrane protein assembly factor BamB
MKLRLLPLLLLLAPACSGPSVASLGGVDSEPVGWPSWRGPEQHGTSLETGLVDTVQVDGEGHLWSYELMGRGTPVIWNGRVYGIGWEGEDKDLEEVVYCLDESNGALQWELRFSDFITDIIYDRYSLGAPTVDVETGNVLFLTAAGLFNCATAEGELLWQHSLMSEFGRLSFPNGRYGAPVIDGDLAIFHIISSHWGPLGPARDRILAFNKNTGEHVWTSSAPDTPKDSSFANPVFDWKDGRRVLYVGTGCGNLSCVDARTGEPIWHFKMSIGGINSSALLYDGGVIAIHGKENIDASHIGRMVSVDGDGKERWRNELVAFTSSPVLVGDRVYVTTHTGKLCCVNADTGEVLWTERLASEQIHASPTWADGKLYVPMNDGSFHIGRPSDEGFGSLCKVQLEGNCLGSPAISSGRIYVHTTKRLYCFGAPGEGQPWPAAVEGPAAGVATRLQIIPGDVLLRPGDAVPCGVQSLDAAGATVATGLEGVVWSASPSLDVEFDDDGVLRVRGDAGYGVGAITAEADGLKDTARVRIVPGGAYSQDFESFEVTEADRTFARPPSHWLGSWPKWDVRELDGSKVLARTLGNPLFQRTITLMGHPEQSNYTVQIDMRTDGNRRTLSTAGVINQRYLALLKGNYQTLEISSNMERIKESVPFKIRADVWYTLKMRVDVAEDGSGVVRAKAWPRDEDEPDDWTLEVEHENAHTHGTPGMWGFTPQSRFRVYVDNITVTPND